MSHTVGMFKLPHWTKLSTNVYTFQQVKEYNARTATAKSKLKCVLKLDYGTFTYIKCLCMLLLHFKVSHGRTDRRVVGQLGV